MIETDAKEIADLIPSVQDQRSKAKRMAFKKALTKFCNDYGLHDDELDAALDRITE